jgi:hypothetical protein
MDSTGDHSRSARQYLTGQLGSAAPADLALAAEFDEHPLEGEGRVSIFTFTAAPGGNPPEQFFVVAGQTQPNYYPSWGLSADEVYSLHIGTRFMLVLEISQLTPAQLPATLEKDTVESLATLAPGAPIGDFRAVAAFALEDHKHAVARCRIAGQEVYVVTADLPLGIYQRVDLPPHVVYRIHLGNVIRLERPDSEPQP